VADGSLIESGQVEHAARRRLPFVLRVALIYLSARVVTTGFFAIAAALAGPGTRFGPHAGIGDLLMGWDAQWYWYVAVNGYPSVLPLTDSGQVAENQWAFLPVYPYLAQAIGVPFGAWAIGGIVISLVAGYLSCLVLYRMLRMRLDRGAATWGVVFFAFAPLAAVFQIGYAESLFLLWLFLAIWLVARRRYGWLYLLVPLMGFTRPGVLAFGLFLGLFAIHRWFTRRTEPFPVREILHVVALGLWAVVVGFAWQVIAAAVTGRPDAYLATELAWRRNWLPDADGDFVPLHGFLQGVAFWFDSWGMGAVTGYIVLGLLVVAIAALLLFEPHVKRLGPEIRLWSASYLVYLLAVFFPQSSIFRLLVPVSPLWGAAAVPRSALWRVTVLVLCLAGQWWWIVNMYAMGNTYWQIP